MSAWCRDKLIRRSQSAVELRSLGLPRQTSDANLKELQQVTVELTTPEGHVYKVGRMSNEERAQKILKSVTVYVVVAKQSASPQDINQQARVLAYIAFMKRQLWCLSSYKCALPTNPYLRIEVCLHHECFAGELFCSFSTCGQPAMH